MGECVSCNKFCCPMDKHFTITDIVSPKNSNFRIEITPVPIRKSLSGSKPICSIESTESPYRKSRTPLRRNTCTITTNRKGFLARAREKSRKNSFINEEEPFSAQIRSFTYADEDPDGCNKTMLRISMDSPLKHDGDCEIIEY